MLSGERHEAFGQLAVKGVKRCQEPILNRHPKLRGVMEGISRGLDAEPRTGYLMPGVGRRAGGVQEHSASGVAVTIVQVTMSPCGLSPEYR